jgi:hypothetical protein
MTQKKPNVADLAYEDTLLTEEEVTELERLINNGLCKPKFEINTDHIIRGKKANEIIYDDYQELN